MANKIDRDWLALLNRTEISPEYKEHLAKRKAEGDCTHLNLMASSRTPLVCERPEGHAGLHEEVWVAQWVDDDHRTIRWCTNGDRPSETVPKYGTKAQQKEKA